MNFLRFRLLPLVIAALTLTLLPSVGYAATHLDGAKTSIYWGLPFVGMLLSIALCPLFVPRFWHKHFGKVAIFWALVFLIPFGFATNWSLAFTEMVHAIVAEYLPFIILLFTLFTVAGGIRLKGSFVGTPKLNTLILLSGVILASWMGTTGAAMLLIRPLLKANEFRVNKKHTVIFFIFLVANIGGSLTPLGDPPLFLGFLKGVDFFWTFTHMMPLMVFMAVCLLLIYYTLDTVLYNNEGRPTPQASKRREKFGIEGKINFILLLAVIGCVLLSGAWNPEYEFNVFGTPVALQDLTRDILLLIIARLSLWLTDKQSRVKNGFNWEPIAEVAKLFFGIFITMAPVIAILKAGEAGSLKSVIQLVSNADGTPNNPIYFWLTGALSSFLDNAPTYLVFFNTAGGNAAHLMTTLSQTLLAISAGAVFMGANTYIGNAPNFMIRSIAENSNVKMPSFFGYMAWSVGILVPLFIILTFFFFIL